MICRSELYDVLVNVESKEIVVETNAKGLFITVHSLLCCKLLYIVLKPVYDC